MRKNKNILKPHFKYIFLLISPTVSLYLIYQHFFSHSDIFYKTVLLSASVENPSKTLSKIKDKFSDILIEENIINNYTEKTDIDKKSKTSDIQNSADNTREINHSEKTENTENTEEQTPQEEANKPSESQEESIIEFVPEEHRGVIIEETFKGGTTPLYINTGPGYLSNRTKIDSQILKNKILKMPAIKLSMSEDPQVLLFSTHATESFEPCDRKFYDKRNNSRSTDNNKNVTQVEDQIAKQLNDNGINTIVDKTQHDFPSYNGSYNRSAITINNYLKKYPSIKVVLDIHRDAIERDNGERVKPVVMINGKKAAQIMIISGCDDGSMNFPNWEQNLNFAVDLQKQIETEFPGLARPIFFCYRKYNMNVCPCSLLIEFGSNSNSLEEVKYSGELMGKALSDLLISYKNN